MIAHRFHLDGSPAGEIGRICARDLSRDRAQFGLGLAHFDTGFEPANGNACQAVSARRGLARIITHRHEDLRLLRRIAHAQRIRDRRQHADHSKRLQAEQKRAADDAGIGSEAPHPQRVAQDYDIGARPAIFVGAKAAAHQHADSQRVEKIVIHAQAAQSLSLAVIDQRSAGIAVQRDTCEAGCSRSPLVSGPKADAADPGRGGIRLRQSDDTARIAVRQLVQQDRFEDAENRRRRSYAERERRHSEQGDAGIAPRHSYGKARVEPDLSGPSSDAHALRITRPRPGF